MVETPAIIDGSELRNASAIQSQGGGADDYEINFSLKRTAPISLARGPALTSTSTWASFSTAKSSRSPTSSRKSSIRDRSPDASHKQSAEDLALTLRSGALPAPIEYLEERTVGPSLGADSIRAGVRASLVGLALVVVFMLFYYRGSGVNAVVALI